MSQNIIYLIFHGKYEYKNVYEKYLHELYNIKTHPEIQIQVQHVIDRSDDKTQTLMVKRWGGVENTPW